MPNKIVKDEYFLLYSTLFHYRSQKFSFKYSIDQSSGRIEIYYLLIKLHFIQEKLHAFLFYREEQQTSGYFIVVKILFNNVQNDTLFWVYFADFTT